MNVQYLVLRVILVSEILPTYKKVLKCVLFESEKGKDVGKNVKIVTDKLINVWQKTAISSVS